MAAELDVRVLDPVGDHLGVGRAEHALGHREVLAGQRGQLLHAVDCGLHLRVGRGGVDIAHGYRAPPAPQAQLCAGQGDGVLPAFDRQDQSGIEVLVEIVELYQLMTRSSAVVLLLLPLGVVTTVSFVPAVRAGLVATISPSLTTLKLVAAVPPKVTAVAPVNF